VRLVSYRSERGDRAGVLVDGGVIDAWDALGGSHAYGLRQLLVDDRVEDLRAAFDGADPVTSPVLLPPIPNPEKIVCIGLNYRSHAEEAGLEPPAAPPIFAKYRNALVAAGEEVALPTASEKVDSSTYWRCETCGQMWNVGRLQSSSRHGYEGR